MQLKKVTQKNSDGSSISYEFSVPPKQEIPHPGNPKGTDTVPAWLTPGEFVMNAEATRMYKPQIEAMNEQGKAVQRQQGGSIPSYHAKGGEAGPCWDGYEMVGMKDKGGKQVPNCVPVDYKACGGKVHYKEEGGFIDWLSSLFGGDVPPVEWPQNDKGVDPNAMVDRAPPAPPQQVPQAPASLYQQALQATANRRGWDADEVKAFDKWRDGVGQVESNNIPTRTQGDKAEGIGRGLYQFETSKGSGAAKTAATRLMNYLPKIGIKFDQIPESDRKVLASDDPDFSLLSADTQHLAFLANHALAPNSRLNDLVSGKVGADEAWADWHWAGSPEERAKKLQMWKNNVQYHSGGSFIEDMAGSVYSALENIAGAGYDAVQRGAGALYEMTPYANQGTADRALQHDPERAVQLVMDGTGLPRTEAEQLIRKQIGNNVEQVPIPQSIPKDTSFPDPDGDMAMYGINREPPVPTPVEKVTMEEVQPAPPVPETGLTSFSVDSSADVPQPEDIPKTPEQIKEEIVSRNAILNPAGFTIETAGDGRYNILNKQGQSVATAGSLELADKWISKNISERIANTEDEREDNSEALEVIAGQKKMAEARGDTELVKSLEEREAELKAEQENPLVLGTTSKEESDAVREIAGKPDMAPQGLGGEPPKPEPNVVDKVIEETQPEADNEFANYTDEEWGNLIDDAMGAGSKDANDNPEKLDTVMNFFDEWGISDLFDKKEIGKMAVMYLGSRALGHSHGGSLNFAMKNYATNVQAKQTAKAKEIKDLLEGGKFEPSSIAKYEKSGDINDLVKKGQTFTPTGNTKYVLYRDPKTKKTQRLKVREVKGSDDNGIYYQLPNGQRINDLSPNLRDYKPEMYEGTPEFNTYNQQAAASHLEALNAVVDVEDAKDDDGNLVVPIHPRLAAEAGVNWARAMGLDPKDSRVQAVIRDAYTAALRENKGKELQATELEPYLTRMSIMQEEQRPQLYERMDSDGKPTGKYISPVDLASIRAMVKEETSEIMKRRSTAVTTKQIWDYAAAQWESLGPEGQEKYHKAALDGDSSGFAKYLEEQLNANKYDRIVGQSK